MRIYLRSARLCRGDVSLWCHSSVRVVLALLFYVLWWIYTRSVQCALPQPWIHRADNIAVVNGSASSRGRSLSLRTPPFLCWQSATCYKIQFGNADFQDEADNMWNLVVFTTYPRWIAARRALYGTQHWALLVLPLVAFWPLNLPIKSYNLYMTDNTFLFSYHY